LFGSTGIIGKTNSASYKGDYILVARVGANAGYLNRVNSTFGVTDNTLIISIDKSKSVDFVYYTLEYLCLNKLIFGSGQPLITGGQLKSLGLFVPSKSEQSKIASFLSLLEDRISTQIQIIEELETFIVGVADSLFDDTRYLFEKSPLSMLCQIKKGEQINSLNLSVNGEYYVMNGGIVPSGYQTEYNSEADTISISEGGNSCCYVQYNSSKFWSGGHCYTLINVNLKVSNKYLYYYLKNQEKNIMALRVGSGLPNIQKRELENVEIKYPSIEKQQKIVKVLNSLSGKIETERNLLSAYQKQKKCLLNQMFI
jgi:type I restriction enzyme S subunit